MQLIDKAKWCAAGKLAAGLACVSLAATLHAAQVEPANKTPDPAAFKSVFVDNPSVGKDPFFPNSARRHVSNEPVHDATAPINLKLKLQGLSGSDDSRLAIINNRTFALGEEAELKIDGKPVTIKCKEIRPRSVMILINGGQPQELKLGARF